MDSFSEFVKCKAEFISISCIRDCTGMTYSKSRSAKIGTLKAAQISFQEAVDLAGCLCVDVDELAAAAELA